jgi:hypothetical protein
VAEVAESYTGQYLKKVLPAGRGKRRKKAAAG